MVDAAYNVQLKCDYYFQDRKLASLQKLFLHPFSCKVCMMNLVLLQMNYSSVMADSIFKFVIIVPRTVFYMLLVRIIYGSKIIALYILGSSFHFYLMLTALDIFSISLS